VKSKKEVRVFYDSVYESPASELASNKSH